MSEFKDSLIPFTPDMARMFRTPRQKQLGMFYQPVKYIVDYLRRAAGRYGTEEQLKIACYCEPPLFFALRGIMISHAYGITLSVDEIGADCHICQNVTIGTNARSLQPGEKIQGHRPRIGNLVRCYPGSVISGSVRIGSRVIIAANAFVSKDVPDDSIVYGTNIIKPMSDNHRQYLKHLLWHCVYVYKLIPGLVYKDNRLFINETYAERRLLFFDN